MVASITFSYPPNQKPCVPTKMCAFINVTTTRIPNIPKWNAFVCYISNCLGGCQSSSALQEVNCHNRNKKTSLQPACQPLIFGSIPIYPSLIHNLRSRDRVIVLQGAEISSHNPPISTYTNGILDCIAITLNHDSNSNDY